MDTTSVLSRLPSTASSVDGQPHRTIDLLSPPESSPPTPSSSTSTIYPNEYASSSVVRRSSIKKPSIKYICRTGPPETAHTILRAGPKTNEDFIVPGHGMEASDFEGLPWTCTEDYRLLLAVTQEHKLTSELIAQNDGILVNWDFVACCVNQNAYHYRSPRQCCLRYRNVILRQSEDVTPIDTPSSYKRSRRTSSSSSSCLDNNNFSSSSSADGVTTQPHPPPSTLMVEAMAKACAYRKQLAYIPSMRPPPQQQLYSLNGTLPVYQLHRMQELGWTVTRWCVLRPAA
uniref:Myb-like domain-containing protein n=1 Tax=Ditylenchus dipsaci TaxID=166011 RepID=A0A915EA63_9BILA